MCYKSNCRTPVNRIDVLRVREGGREGGEGRGGEGRGGEGREGGRGEGRGEGRGGEELLLVAKDVDD